MYVHLTVLIKVLCIPTRFEPAFPLFTKGEHLQQMLEVPAEITLNAKIRKSCQNSNKECFQY